MFIRPPHRILRGDDRHLNFHFLTTTFIPTYLITRTGRTKRQQQQSKAKQPANNDQPQPQVTNIWRNFFILSPKGEPPSLIPLTLFSVIVRLTQTPTPTHTYSLFDILVCYIIIHSFVHSLISSQVFSSQLQLTPPHNESICTSDCL